MDVNSNTGISNTSSRPPHASDRERDDKTSFKLKIPPTHRSTRYKEKFQALRERYDQVTTAHDEYQRDLDAAAARIKALQAENDLLLDAIHIAAPTLIHLASPLQPELDSHRLTPEGVSEMHNTDHILGNPSRPSHVPSQLLHVNGNTHSHSNSTRHWLAEPNDRDIRPDELLSYGDPNRT